MNSNGPWSTDDFDDMSWHDVHVHGLSLAAFDSAQGSADLLLDIDYILEWSQEGEKLQFDICPAELRFEQVFGLKVSLDYKSSSAGMCPFSIAEIKRERVAYPTGHSSYKWSIEVNWPLGLIEFESPGFRQRLVGHARRQPEPWLSPEHRAKIDA